MPVTSGSYAKLFVFMLAAAGCAALGFSTQDAFGILLGSLPIILATFGLVMTVLSRSVSHVRTSGRIISSLFGIGLTAMVILGARVISDPYGGGPEFLLAGVAALVGLIATHYLFTKSLDPHEEWIAEHGLLPIAAKKNDGATASSIVKVENLKSFSVADELLKWSRLHEEGVISDEEFAAAKKRLLT